MPQMDESCLTFSGWMRAEPLQVEQNLGESQVGGFTNNVGLYTSDSCEVGSPRQPAVLLVACWAPPPLCLWVCFVGCGSVTGPRRLQFVHRSASRWNAATFPDDIRSLSTEERKKDSIRTIDMGACVLHEAVLILEGGWV